MAVKSAYITRKLAKGEKPPLVNSGFSSADEIKAYRDMLLIRRFEEKVNEMYTKAKIGGYCHLNIGEESLIVGTMAAINRDDYVLASYREHGHALVRGVPADAIMAEIEGFFVACRAERVWPGGVHLEYTGEDVTECLGGSEQLAVEQLDHRYETLCDPRLNARQSLDLAFRLAELMRR